MNKVELLNQKAVLEQERADIEAGGKFPSLLRSKEYALSAYQDQINALDQRIKDAEREEEREAKRKQAEEAANEQTRATLRGIIEQLPAEWKPEIAEDRYDGPFIKAVGCSFSIKTVYAGNGRFSRGYPTGVKLVASTSFESRGFPKKKDGTFSVDKAVAFVKEQQEIQAAKDARYSSDAAKLERFKQLVKPYSEYSVYDTEKEFRVGNDFVLKVKRAYGEEEKYIVWRTTSETVTAEQLQQILANEVGEVKRDKQEA